MSLRRAKVRFKNEPAGTLEETVGGGTRFAYAQGFEQAIACSLPIARREHEWPEGLHPFFEHLAPEGWLRQQQARTGHIQEQDDFGLLLRYGADCIGAVGIVGEDTPPPPALEAQEINPRRTVSGIQKKLLVRRDPERREFRPALATGPAPYIAKFNSATIDTLVRNEALSLKWTAAVLAPDLVNEAQVSLVGEVNEVALVVTRFDRTPEGAKLRLEDFAQILNKPRGRDYSGKYDSSYEAVAQVIREHSVRPAIDLARFFRRLVAFALVGNCDAHLKNFSLLETGDGLRLSPVYDVLNTLIYDRYDRRLALTIDGARVPAEEITGGTLQKFGASIGLPPGVIKQSFDQLRRVVPRANEKFLTPPAAEPGDGFVHRFEEVVKNACLRILQ